MTIRPVATRDIIASALRGLSTLWRDGFRYIRADVMLSDFISQA
ncbi:hypothetical protein CKS_2961 [Pantoea stewartii subsp. stewartii DC283]|uniref:Uncharacterized protein n=1 Tax=Pantoea stewartii subsp. stewartii DC283 TaxID=660596 RepID=H3RKQ7_PANSE|nr:hypothetical protein CKS_2961 [Pantoea stewartii subsp. stewartii DC283]